MNDLKSIATTVDSTMMVANISNYATIGNLWIVSSWIYYNSTSIALTALSSLQFQ